MKLVSFNLRPDFKIGIFAVNFKNGVSMSLGALKKIKSQRQYAGHRIGFAFQNQVFSQIHQPPTLGIDGKAFFNQGLEPDAEFCVVRQLLGMGFRKTAADIKTIEFRQFFVLQRADKNDLRSLIGQGIDVFRIIKLKSRILDNTNAGLLVSLFRPAGFGGQAGF